MLNHSMIASRAILNDYNPFNDGTGKALWKMDGDVTDASVTYNGTAYNLTYDTGVFGQAAVFNGTSSYVQIGAGIAAFKTNAFTISAWVYTGSSAHSGAIFDNNYNSAANGSTLNSGSQMRLISGYPAIWYCVRNTETVTNSDGKSFTDYVVRNDSSTLLPLNQRVHLCAVVNGNNSALYVNGVLDCTVSSTQTIQYSTANDNTAIGATKYDASTFNYFNGQIDHVRFFTSALTAAQVLQLYQEEI